MHGLLTTDFRRVPKIYKRLEVKNEELKQILNKKEIVEYKHDENNLPTYSEEKA